MELQLTSCKSFSKELTLLPHRRHCCGFFAAPAPQLCSTPRARTSHTAHPIPAVDAGCNCCDVYVGNQFVCVQAVNYRVALTENSCVILEICENYSFSHYLLFQYQVLESLSPYRKSCCRWLNSSTSIQIYLHKIKPFLYQTVFSSSITYGQLAFILKKVEILRQNIHGTMHSLPYKRIGTYRCHKCTFTSILLTKTCENVGKPFRA